MAERNRKKRHSGKSAAESAAGKMVPLSLAVALLIPLSEAYAQFDLNCAQALRFGSVAPCGGVGGSITITPAGAISSKGCVVMMNTPKQALCTVKSYATSGTIQVKLSAKKTVVNGPGTMDVKAFNIATAGGGPTYTFSSTALTATPMTFGVGGRLIINAGQAFGAYSGNLMMKVTFTP
ncbi:MAG: DUF4402 domain-containing protein [Rhodospirillales bacterium]|nr:DUF4402 domain-containing protein [Rhodospirillales bacterium]MCB9996210.1 DUF4402 domain-containing protein [Rhodospirillales bacterium]